MRWDAIALVFVGLVLFQCFGNATRGYVNTPSLFWWWISQWLDPNAESQHGWLILGLSAWLFWRNLRSDERRVTSDASEPKRSMFGGSLWAFALVAGLALHAVGFVSQLTRLSIIAALFFAWGIVKLAGGKRWGRAAAFPLGFMIFAIPVNVLDSVGFWLRLWVIDGTEMIAHAAGVHVLRSGTQLIAPDGSYHYDVAAACSGVRSLMALSALSLLIGYLNFRSWRRRALMLLLCFPLVYLANLARIVAIVFAAKAGGQAWGEYAHRVMGYAVFVIVVGGVLAVAEIMRRRWPEKDHATSAAGAARQEPRACELETASARRSQDFAGWKPALLLAILAGAEMLFLAHVAAAPASGAAGVRLAADGIDPIELPAFIGTDWIGRSMKVTTVEREILPVDTGFSRRSYVSVQDRAHTVFVSIVLSGRDRTSIHRPELCLVGLGWTIASSAERRLNVPGGTLPVTLLRTQRTEPSTHRTQSALVAYWFVDSEQVVASHWRRVLCDAWNRLRHGRVDRWAYVLMQADANDGEAAALARMQEVLDGTWPSFQAVR